MHLKCRGKEVLAVKPHSPVVVLICFLSQGVSSDSVESCWWQGGIGARFESKMLRCRVGAGWVRERAHVTADTVPEFSLHSLSARSCASWVISESISSSYSSSMVSHCRNAITTYVGTYACTEHVINILLAKNMKPC